MEEEIWTVLGQSCSCLDFSNVYGLGCCIFKVLVRMNSGTEMQDLLQRLAVRSPALSCAGEEAYRLGWMAKSSLLFTLAYLDIAFAFASKCTDSQYFASCSAIYMYNQNGALHQQIWFIDVLYYEMSSIRKR